MQEKEKKLTGEDVIEEEKTMGRREKILKRKGKIGIEVRREIEKREEKQSIYHKTKTTFSIHLICHMNNDAIKYRQIHKLCLYVPFL
jgi:CRISPR/Cas system CMR-associated protein Cmr3 (group 5 of RAMP superfamily)